MDLAIVRLVEAGVPKKFYDLRAETFPGESETFEAFQKLAQAFLERKNQKRPYLFLRGPALSGKTFLGTLLLRAYMAVFKESKVKYVTVDSLTDMFYGESREWKNLLNYDLLMLDNLNHTDHLGHKNSVSTLITACHDADLPLIVCSRMLPENGKDSELIQSYGLDTAKILTQNSVSIRTKISAESLKKLRQQQTAEFVGD